MAIPREKTELENYLVYGIDLKNRRIFFGHPLNWGRPTEDDQEGYNDFTEHSVEIAVRAIKRMESDHPNKPIEIHMNSLGGDYKAMLYLVDVMEASTCQFKFYGGGRINSSATWFLAVCDERYLYRNTTLVLHNGRRGYAAEEDASYDDAQIDMKYEKDEINRLNTMFADNSHYPKQVWDDLLKRDLKVSAQEAVTMGIAMAIVPRPKRGNLRKKRKAQMDNPPHPTILRALLQKLYRRVGINPSGKKITLTPPPVLEYDSNVVVDNTPIEIEKLNEENKNETEET